VAFQENSAMRVRLTDAARRGAGEYASEYVSLFEEITTSATATHQRTGSVRCLNIGEVAEAVKVGVLYNDVSLVDVVEAGSGGKFVMPGLGSGFARKYPQLTVTVPKSILAEMRYAIDNKRVNPTFFIQEGDEMDQLLTDIAPLIQAGRVLLRPRRMLMYDTAVPTDKGGTTWHTVDAAADAPADTWKVPVESLSTGDKVVTNLAFENGYSLENVQDIRCKIALPFIKGISLEDYSRIIDDEHDLLVEFRAAISALWKEAEKFEGTLEEYVDDVVNPRIAKIDRSFKRIAGTTGLRVAGATVATAVLSLTSYLSAGSTAALLALAGSAGAVTSLKELADRKDKLGSAKDDPLYLLWRMKTAGAS
jgi:hypothetical protein